MFLKLSKKPTRDEVLNFLATSASYGNLGLFIGAGLSKAVLNESSEDEIALSWGGLLQGVAKKMDVNYDSLNQIGTSYPEIASAICRAYRDKKHVSFKESLGCLKREISALTCWYPADEQRQRYSQYLESFAPSWIITTNYDLVIESLLTGKSITLGPNDPLSAPKGVVPVFHLHGVRTNPDGIIIAQEDYVTLFRPSEYRQIRLALTIKESTTLLLGYALGDVNVLTALDWSKYVFKRTRENYPHGVIQVLRKKKPSDEPYRAVNGVVILETEALSGFFEEFSVVRDAVMKVEEKKAPSIGEARG